MLFLVDEYKVSGLSSVTYLKWTPIFECAWLGMHLRMDTEKMCVKEIGVRAQKLLLWPLAVTFGNSYKSRAGFKFLCD